MADSTPIKHPPTRLGFLNPRHLQSGVTTLWCQFESEYTHYSERPFVTDLRTNFVESRFAELRLIGVLRTSPFGDSRKLVKKFQISLIWGMLRSTQLSRVSSAYASRGLEPCSVAGGHVGHGEPVVQPAAARARRRLRL